MSLVKKWMMEEEIKVRTRMNQENNLDLGGLLEWR